MSTLQIMAENAGKEPSEQALIDALRAAGWLLEQETQTVFASHGFTVAPGVAYQDPDDRSTSREIDVVAVREVLRDEGLQVQVLIKVIVECKQSDTPYVLIGRPADLAEIRRDRPEHTFEQPKVETHRRDGSILRMPAHRYLGLDVMRGSPWNDQFIATQMTRLERSGSNSIAKNEHIFTSLVHPLAKAVMHYRKLMGAVSLGGGATIEFRLPVVVTSAALYKLDATSLPYTPERVGWVPMARQIKTKSVDGVFHIDVVNFEYLEDYIFERVDEFERGLRKIPARMFRTGTDFEWGEANPLT